MAEKAAGRVPVVAGATFEGGLEEQARLMNEMGKFVDVVVIITNQIARMDEVQNVQHQYNITMSIMIILYILGSKIIQKLLMNFFSFVY